MYRKFDEIWTCVYDICERTYRQTDSNTTHIRTHKIAILLIPGSDVKTLKNWFDVIFMYKTSTRRRGLFRNPAHIDTIIHGNTG